MPNTTDYEFGDIVLVPFPFTDQTAAKKRPAVVVSSVAYNRNRPDNILMAVTSQMQSPGYFGDVAVAEWQQAGLIKPSLIKPIFSSVPVYFGFSCMSVFFSLCSQCSSW
jgi:mRNA interferase MazF